MTIPLSWLPIVPPKKNLYHKYNIMYNDHVSLLFPSFPIPRTNKQSHQLTGTSALHLSIAYRNGELFDLLLRLGANVNERASGTFFMPTDQQQERKERKKRQDRSGSSSGRSHHHQPSNFSGERSYCLLLQPFSRFAQPVSLSLAFTMTLRSLSFPHTQSPFEFQFVLV